jgi:hypothetical protein
MKTWFKKYLAKLASGLQVIFGVLVVLSAWSLYLLKRYDSPEPHPHPSPSYFFENVLIIAGIFIFILALIQLIKRLRLAALHAALGENIIVLSLVLNSLALVDVYEYPSEVHWMFFFMIAVAIMVIITGIIQISSRSR